MRSIGNRAVIGFLSAIVLLLAIQNVMLWQGMNRLQKTVESADVSAMDALEVAKDIKTSLADSGVGGSTFRLANRR